MVSTLTCIKREENWFCRLIKDGKRVGEYTVKNVEVISPEGQEISSETEISLDSFIIATDDNLECSKEGDKLVCKGTVSAKVVTKKPPSIWERLFGGSNYWGGGHES